MNISGIFRTISYKARHQAHAWAEARERLGRDPFRDIQKLTKDVAAPVILDVGANDGRSVRGFVRALPRATIHSFEPGPDTFAVLQRNVGGLPNVKLNNMALGARRETREFIENACHDMSSFLEVGSAGWGEEKGRRSMEIGTVDEYCRDAGVARIDVLKTDTQGFDLEVIRGAETMILQKKVHLIYLEINFAELYVGMPALDEIYRHLVDRGFLLATFYEFHYRQDRAAWTDALFVHPGFAP